MIPVPAGAPYLPEGGRRHGTDVVWACFVRSHGGCGGAVPGAGPYHGR